MFELRLMKLGRKILAVFLLSVIVMGMYPLSSIAADGVEVKVGNHGSSTPNNTNMIIKFILSGDLSAFETFGVQFTAVGDASHKFMDAVDTLDANLDFTIKVDGDTTYTVGSNASATPKSFGVSISQSTNQLTFITPKNMVAGTPGDDDNDGDIDAGKIIELYIGADDDTTIPYEVYLGDTYFNNSGVNYLYNSEFADEAEVTVTDNGTSYLGNYAIDTSGKGVGYQREVRGKVDPYIRLSLDSTSMTMPNLAVDTISTAELTGTISTNAPNGYTLKYRTTSFANVDDANKTIDAVGDVVLPGLSDVTLTTDGSLEGWGIGFKGKMADGSSATIPSIYSYGDNDFAVGDDSVLYELASTSVADITAITLEAGASVTAETEAVSYQSVITLNLYAKF